MYKTSEPYFGAVKVPNHSRFEEHFPPNYAPSKLFRGGSMVDFFSLFLISDLWLHIVIF